MKNVEKKVELIKSALRITDFKSFLSTKSEDAGKNVEFSQEQIIKDILAGKDILAIIPTGGGKSYCFQGPAICFEGLTVVITPLVALIKDQVENFNKRMDQAFIENRASKRYKAIYPGMNNYSTANTFDEIISPHDENTEYKLLYLSPERLSLPKFVRLLQEKEKRGSIRIDHVVIDEVHCLSQWGFDFRESYLRITNFINSRPHRPHISAFTATATPQDIKYIKALLGFDAQIKKGKFSYYENIIPREELKLVFRSCNDGGDEIKAPTRFEALISILKNHRVNSYSHKEDTIIYCTTRKQVEYLYKTLREEDIVPENRICKYHANLNESTKLSQVKKFKGNSGKEHVGCIMIATKAFGMGIDNNNINLIIHYDIPLCLEEYYQEIGRAGRGDHIKKAFCYLLFSFGTPETEGDSPPNGSYLATKIWINSDIDNLRRLEKMPIESRLPWFEKYAIIYLNKYRFLAVKNYCNKLKGRNNEENSIKRQKYIVNYLKKEIHSNNESVFVETYKDKDLTIKKEFLEKLGYKKETFNSGDLDNILLETLIKDLRSYIRNVNDLHINNTLIANILRWHSMTPSENDKFCIQINEIKQITIDEWKRKDINIRWNEQGAPPKTINVSSPDIQYDSAFILAEDPSNPSILKSINYVWKNQPKDLVRKSTCLFIVSSEYKTIAKALIWNKEADEWRLFHKGSDHNIDKLFNIKIKDKKVPSSIKGLFTKARYASWLSLTLESYEKDLRSENRGSIDYTPFAYVKGKRSRKVSFAIYGESLPNYFDMCVADAVYSIGVSGSKFIYINKIWEVLTGDRNIKFSRRKSAIWLAIENSLEKMMKLEIYILDPDAEIEIPRQSFLPLKKKGGEKKGYEYEISPLYRYAEDINGELIRVPISLMAVHLNNNNIFKPSDLDASIDKYTYNWKATLENAVLCHYLLHRISIYNAKKRPQYISIYSLRKILSDEYLTESRSKEGSFLKLKILFILLYYKNIEYTDFCGYDENAKKEYLIAGPYNDEDDRKELQKEMDGRIYVENGKEISHLIGIKLKELKDDKKKDDEE